ncbi:alanine--glyoxylate aminotransferase family protein [Candidatus Bipolaricaulota bacterium]|nr:alanine--glyoxylate aminotransferase family protein [Candidatus Bipolaricaulota bacterium]
MVPGPIEFEVEVLQALGAPTASHVDPDFVDVFGEALALMRTVWRAPEGQPFVLAGSGTLAMEAVGANLIEPGDGVLVLSTGVFGDRFEDLFSRYGARVTVVRSEIGYGVDWEKVEQELSTGDYRLVTATHVDTSTAVRVDPRRLGDVARRHDVLAVLDGVCSVAGERIDQDEWGLDAVFTASQKAIGVPPGLALFVVSPRALNRFLSRRTKVPNYYCDWAQWLPIMQAYQQGKAAYFATPAVNHIKALRIALRRIQDEGLDARFERHRRLGEACRSALTALGLAIVPENEGEAANTLSAAWYPHGADAGTFLAAVREAGVVLAGGLHPKIAPKYFRVGHMGATGPGELLATIGAIERGLCACGVGFEPGVGLRAAQRVYWS